MDDKLYVVKVTRSERKLHSDEAYSTTRFYDRHLYDEATAYKCLTDVLRHIVTRRCADIRKSGKYGGIEFNVELGTVECMWLQCLPQDVSHLEDKVIHEVYYLATIDAAEFSDVPASNIDQSVGS